MKVVQNRREKYLNFGSSIENTNFFGTFSQEDCILRKYRHYLGRFELI